MNKILENLEAIRKKRGVKQEVIAKALGVSQATYSGYFNETGDMMISRIQEIADILKVELIDIVTYPDKYIPESESFVECEECRNKDAVIKSLTNYISLLEGKVSLVPKK